jgi:hypothetical protein
VVIELLPHLCISEILKYITMERQEVIDQLVDFEEAKIVADIQSGDTSVLDSMIRYGGIEGYDNLSNKELEEEYLEQFDKLITIK